jgi:hydroxyacylglutathione hydrolase
MKTWETHSGLKIYQLFAGRSNVFLVTNGKMNIVVDTSPARKWSKLKSRFSKLGIRNIDFLVLTHTHFDHAGNAMRIKNTFNAKIIVHQTEANILETGISIIPKGTNWLTRLVVNPLGKRYAPKTNFIGCSPDILVDSTFSFEEFGLNCYILHTPGHTIGSMSLLVDNEIALVGDAMFGIFPNSIFPPFADDVSEMVKSWNKLLGTNCKLFLPAHGTANKRKLVEKGFQKLNQLYVNP